MYVGERPECAARIIRWLSHQHKTCRGAEPVHRGVLPHQIPSTTVAAFLQYGSPRGRLPQFLQQALQQAFFGQRGRNQESHMRLGNITDASDSGLRGNKPSLIRPCRFFVGCISRTAHSNESRSVSGGACFTTTPSPGLTGCIPKRGRKSWDDAIFVEPHTTSNPGPPQAVRAPG